MPVTFRAWNRDIRHDHISVRIERFVNERRDEGPQRRNLERVSGDRAPGRLVGPFDTVLEEKAPTAPPAPATFLDGYRGARYRGDDGIAPIQSKDTPRGCHAYSTVNAKVMYHWTLHHHIHIYLEATQIPLNFTREHTQRRFWPRSLKEESYPSRYLALCHVTGQISLDTRKLERKTRLFSFNYIIIITIITTSHNVVNLTSRKLQKRKGVPK